MQYYGNTEVSKIHYLFVCLFSLICAACLLKYSECVHNEDKEAENCVGVVRCFLFVCLFFVCVCVCVLIPLKWLLGFRQNQQVVGVSRG